MRLFLCLNILKAMYGILESIFRLLKYFFIFFLHQKVLLSAISSFATESWLIYFEFFVFLMSFDGLCSVALPHGAVGQFAECDCGIS